MGNREQRTGVFEMPNDPGISDLFRIALRDLRLALRTHTVATVTAYNPATQRATVLVDILSVVKNNAVAPTRSNPAPSTVQQPVTLVDIPVAWPRTGAGYLTFPLAPGDKGELHVQDRSLEAWLSLGQATDPVAAWTHNLADSIFHPHVFTDASPITPPTSATAAVLEGPLVWLGALATAPIVKGPDIVAALNAYASSVDSANTILNGLAAAWGGVPGPGAVAFAGGFAAWNASISAASATLATALSSALSTKTFTE